MHRRVPERYLPLPGTLLPPGYTTSRNPTSADRRRPPGLFHPTARSPLLRISSCFRPRPAARRFPVDERTGRASAEGGPRMGRWGAREAMLGIVAILASLFFLSKVRLLRELAPPPHQLTPEEELRHRALPKEAPRLRGPPPPRTIAFVIVVTRDGPYADGAAVLAESIRQSCSPGGAGTPTASWRWFARPRCRGGRRQPSGAAAGTSRARRSLSGTTKWRARSTGSWWRRPAAAAPRS